MNLRILGSRVLVRNYSLPAKIGSLEVPEAYRSVYDGQTYEVLAVGGRVAGTLSVAADLGETVIPALSADVDGPPLVLEPDDIVICKGLFKGAYSPEMSAVYGFNVWFLDVTEQKHDRPTCAIRCVWPSRRWKEETEAA